MVSGRGFRARIGRSVRLSCNSNCTAPATLLAPLDRSSSQQVSLRPIYAVVARSVRGPAGLGSLRHPPAGPLCAKMPPTAPSGAQNCRPRHQCQIRRQGARKNCRLRHRAVLKIAVHGTSSQHGARRSAIPRATTILGELLARQSPISQLGLEGAEGSAVVADHPQIAWSTSGERPHQAPSELHEYYREQVPAIVNPP